MEQKTNKIDRTDFYVEAVNFMPQHRINMMTKNELNTQSISFKKWLDGISKRQEIICVVVAIISAILFILSVWTPLIPEVISLPFNETVERAGVQTVSLVSTIVFLGLYVNTRRRRRRETMQMRTIYNMINQSLEDYDNVLTYDYIDIIDQDACQELDIPIESDFGVIGYREGYHPRLLTQGTVKECNDWCNENMIITTKEQQTTE